MALTAIDDVGVMQNETYDGRMLQQWYASASTPDGEIYAHDHLFDTEAAAERFASRVRTAGFINLDHWIFTRTIYGTPAFEAEEEEAYVAAQMIRGGWAREDDFADNIRTLL